MWMAIERTYVAQRLTGDRGSAQQPANYPLTLSLLSARYGSLTAPPRLCSSPVVLLLVRAPACLCLCAACVVQLGSNDPATACQLPSFVLSVLSRLQSSHPQSIQRLLEEKLPAEIRSTLQRYTQSGHSSDRPHIGHSNGSVHIHSIGSSSGNSRSQPGKVNAATPLSPQPSSLQAPSRPIHTSSSHPSLNAFHNGT